MTGTHYALGEDDAGFYAEFLTPLRGSGVKRNGDPDVTLAKAGITAQKLKHLDVLLVEPWPIRIGPAQGVAVPAPIDVLVANPVSFIAQKLLIQKYRSPAKCAQDVLYIHDTIELFGASLPNLQRVWTDTVRPAIGETAARNVLGLSDETFADTTDLIRDAALIPQDRSLSPERLRASCALGLRQILPLGVPRVQ